MALISVVLILPETKGVSLERMDKLFGDVDAVAAGEEHTAAEKIEAITYSAGVGEHVEGEGVTVANAEEKRVEVAEEKV